MKKILLAFFVLGFVASAKAQLGIRGGFSSANFSNSDFTALSSFHVGGYYQISSGGLFSFEPGIQYSGKGYNTTSIAGEDVTDKLGYLDVPVLVRLNFLPILNVFAGPQLSFLMSRDYTRGTSSSNSLEPVRGYEYGAVVGVGVSIFSGLNAQVSYDMGLSSLNYFNTDVSNRVLKLSLGYTFNK
ncbi:porin family protein [Algoriphagus sp. AK58]|uniref:porin family protein n=1 Tax=Algoriphagus sp. AK58 TaxID=1406877 RepID=UPI0016506775|nr:porin family protein [Algoriphagus sp. AK58]MBC6368367.1 PorT family protein [Algoriphagus sp. AK58]